MSSLEQPKRVALTTVSASLGSGSSSSSGSAAATIGANNKTTTAGIIGSSSSSTTSSSSTANGPGGGGSASGSKTYRFELKLFEPTADSFPEFNYAKLVEMEEKKQKKLAKVNGSSSAAQAQQPGSSSGSTGADPFGDPENDDDVARIARELERKYGNAYAGKNCGKNSAGSACYDKGTGYDESDSFIDNTDAYDESVPVEIETERGGFYINSGSLVFKALANFERPDDALRIPKARKRTLSTSSESEEDVDGETDSARIEKAASMSAPSDKKPKLQIDKDRLQKTTAKAKDLMASNPSGEQHQDGGKKIVKTTTVKDMLRAKRDSMRNMIDGSSGSGAAPIGGTSGEDGEASESAGGSEDSSTDDDDEDDDDDDDDEDDAGAVGAAEAGDGDAGENLAGDDDMADDDAMEGLVNGDPHRPPVISAATNPSDVANRPNGITSSAATASDIRLPADLPGPLVENILRLRDAGTKVASAAASSTGPSKFSILFDAGNTELLYRIDTAARNVSGTARNTIYNYLEHYLPCTKQTLQMRAKKCRLQREEAKTQKIVRQLRVAVNGVMPQVMAAYEVECKRISDLRAEAARADNREQLAALKAPKRRFVWTETTRALNEQLFVQRRQSFFVIKPRKETLEEFVHKYVREHVVPVWPDGFMRLEELVREFEKRQSTSTAGKKAKEKKTTESTTKPAAMPSNVEQVDASRADLSKHSAMNKPQSHPVSIVEPTTAQSIVAAAAVAAAAVTSISTKFNATAAVSATTMPSNNSTVRTATTPAIVPPAPTTPTTTTLPHKRSTDHSINSIISSSPVPQTTATHSATPSPTPTPTTSSTSASATQPTALPTNSTGPTISLAPKPHPFTAVSASLPNPLPSTTSHLSAGLISSRIEGITSGDSLKIGQPVSASLSAQSQHQPIKAQTAQSQTTITTTAEAASKRAPIVPTARAAAAADDSDSDDVEFVGECDFIDTLPQRARPQANATVPAPKPSAIQINRNKYAAKKSMDALEERSNSPKTNIAPPPLTTTSSAPIVTKAGGVVNIDAADAKRGGAMETSDGKAEDLDVDKIMSALKELQKPQPLLQTANQQRNASAQLHHHQLHHQNDAAQQLLQLTQQHRRLSTDKQQQQKQPQHLMTATLDPF